MKITLLSKPGFSGNMLVRKIEEVAKRGRCGFTYATKK